MRTSAAVTEVVMEVERKGRHHLSLKPAEAVDAGGAGEEKRTWNVVAFRVDLLAVTVRDDSTTR